MKPPKQTNSAGIILDKKPEIAWWSKFHLIMLLPAGLMLAIFLSSLLHTDGTTPGFGFIGSIRPDLQSGLHVPMFFGLTLVLLMLLQRIEKRKRNLVLYTFVLANYVGIMNEGLQVLIPGRHASVGDIGLNLVGSILGLVFYIGIKYWKFRNWGN
jgi:VanZ family protein